MCYLILGRNNLRATPSPKWREDVIVLLMLFVGIEEVALMAVLGQEGRQRLAWRPGYRRPAAVERTCRPPTLIPRALMCSVSAQVLCMLPFESLHVMTTVAPLIVRLLNRDTWLLVHLVLVLLEQVLQRKGRRFHKSVQQTASWPPLPLACRR